MSVILTVSFIRCASGAACQGSLSARQPIKLKGTGTGTSSPVRWSGTQAGSCMRATGVAAP
eukprot:scaffold33069_cov53-Prasinocladus_malaysianus.AAC.1